MKLRILALPVFLLAIAFSCNANAAPKTVKLSWTAPPAQTGLTLTGYKVYRGTTSGGEGATAYATVTSGAVVSFTDTAVTPGVSYFYRVTSTATCDSSVWDCSAFVGESGPSNEASTGVIPREAAPAPGAPSAVTVVVQ